MSYANSLDPDETPRNSKLFWHSDNIFNNIGNIEALWKLKQTRHLVDDNLFSGPWTSSVRIIKSGHGTSLKYIKPFHLTLSPPLTTIVQNANRVHSGINPYPIAKVSSATFLVCFNFHTASKSFKLYENIVRVSNSLGSGTVRLFRVQAVWIGQWSRSAG